MSDIKIHVFHTGQVCIAPDLAFGGEHSNIIKASGVFTPEKDRIWMLVSAYLIEHPKGKFLVDTGWGRSMSPNGEFDRHAQIKSLGSPLLYRVNQGVVPLEECIDEQLEAMGVSVADLDAVLLTHLDCDHANGIEQVKDARKFLVSADEVKYATELTSHARYHKKWWEPVELTEFEWNDTEGPYGKSYDLLGDGSIQLIWIPGHCAGLFAVKVTNDEGKFVLLFSDGGYAKKSWEDLIISGIQSDKEEQLKSLEWIREQSLDPNCIESLANHDPDIKPHVIEL